MLITLPFGGPMVWYSTLVESSMWVYFFLCIDKFAILTHRHLANSHANDLSLPHTKHGRHLRPHIHLVVIL